MTCSKSSFSSKLEATKTILHIWKENERLGVVKMPRRAYYCPHCKSWHLTSRTDN